MSTRTAARPLRATQADVARIAGVSQTTVSMVITGAGEQQRRVSEPVRRRVLDAIEMTGYTANPVAQRLAGGSTSIVGVYTYESVFPHSASDFYHPFLEGVENEAEQVGVDLLMFTSAPSRGGRRLTTSGGVARLRLADGCVLLGRHSYAEDLAELLRQDFAFAFVGRRDSPEGAVPCASAAYDTATASVVEALLNLGHRQIVLVSQFSEHESMRDRVHGYRSAMAGARLRPIVLDEPDVSSSQFFATLRAVSASAVVTSSDLAAPLRRAALDRGLAVPGDLSIARLGDPETPEAERVDWSGFVIPRREMGAAALRVVLRQLAARRGRNWDAAAGETLRVSIPCTVIEGSTVSAPARPGTGSSASTRA